MVNGRHAIRRKRFGDGSAPLRRPSLAIVLVGLLVAGCYGSDASNNPGDASQLIQSISRSGLVVASTVSGDTGCGDPNLVGNAIHLTVVAPTDPTPHDLYIFRFLPKAYTTNQAEVDACQATVAAAHPGVAMQRFDVSPVRAFGVGLSQATADVIGDAVKEYSNSGVQQ